MTRWTLAAVACLWAAIPSLSFAASLSGLRCQDLTDPVGIEATTPRLSWVITSEQRGERQTAYQVLVASSAELLAADQGDLWDSGKRASEQSQHVPYAGKPLHSLAQCHWKVRIWDRHERPSPWSAPAQWTMALLQPAEWRGQWIGTPRRTAVDANGAPGFLVEMDRPDQGAWVQVDLGSVQSIDRIVLHPMRQNDPQAGGWIDGYAFPLRFKVEIADDAAFQTARPVADHTRQDFANPGWKPVRFEVGGQRGRYVRLTATKLWHRGNGLPYVMTLGQIQVFSADRNVALHQPVQASHSREGQGWRMANLTDGLRLCPDTSAAGPAPELEKNPYAAILLRKEVDVAKPVRRALVCLCGLGWSELSIEGRKVGAAVLSPQFCDYDKRVEYVMHDVTAYLHPGRNALGVVLGNGFSATPSLGYLGWYGNGGPPRLLLQLEIEYADGTSERIVSDESWKWSTGEITLNDLWAGEHIDHRRAQPGWDRAGFRDAAWHPAITVEAPAGRLFARFIAPLKVLETAAPVSIEGNTFHFEATGAGWLRLKTRGQSGDKVTVHYNAERHTSGWVATGLAMTTECTLRGEGVEEFEPKFIFHTIGKDVIVDGLPQPATAETLTRELVGIDLPRVGHFACSNEFLNQQYATLLRTQRNYNYDYPLDPTREKSGWTQDVMTMFDSAVYDFDSAAFYRNWWLHMRDNQRADGYLGSVVPLVNRVLDDCNCVWWSGMIVYTPWKLYTVYGDRQMLAESYPAMQAYMQWLATKADPDQVISWGLGDWLEVGTESMPRRTSVALTSTCGYYHYATIMSRTAAVLDQPEEAARYARLAEAIRAGFNRRFLQASSGQYGDQADSQTAQILPLSLGLVPNERRSQVIDRLIENIHQRHDHISTGFIGTLHLLLGLPEIGQADLGYQIVTQPDFPGWNTLVREGVQMETWDGQQVQMPSLGGPIGAYLYQVLAGIRPDPQVPGFQKILIKPSIVGDLTWVQAHFDSPYGRILSHWKREAGHLTMEITIPANTTAVVYVPTADAPSVTESGNPAAAAEGVKFLRMENGAAVFEVGSGTYQFCGSLDKP